jgi:beta-phosphoglucomutase-like phosphatase (HAD superfamily)
MRKKAKLYDCDNTLVLTEKTAFQSGAQVLNDLLSAHGIAQIFSPEALQQEFVGRTFQESVLKLANDFHFEIEDLDGWVEREKNAVIAAFRGGLEPCSGAQQALKRSLGKFQVAVVSSSAKDRVLVSLDVAGLGGIFDERQIFSAQTCLENRKGKPAPDIYQHALRTLSLNPEDCIAFEDTVAGVRAARGAGIDVVGYLGCYEEQDRQVMSKALSAAGACALMPCWDDEDKVLAEVRSGD